jgi:septal ring factor EnvC (AmiA/AmiB activator)
MQIDAQSAATEQAAQAMAEEKQLTAEQSQALDRLKRADAAVADMTKHLLDLYQRRDEAQARIDHLVAALRSVVPAILRMSTYPVETLLAAQAPPDSAVRGMLVMRTMAHQAEVDAQSLIEDRQTLDAATKAAAEVAPQLAAARAARSAEADALARKLAETEQHRKAAEQAAAAAAQRAAAEAAQASTLRSMLEILETQRRLEEAQAREDELRAQRQQKDAEAEAARAREAAVSRPVGAGALSADAKPAGQIIQPVAGTLVRGWGDTQDGEPATGQSWQTQPGAEVVAPCGGTVAFAEPFRGYGLLVIIDCGGGYHAILAGMDQMRVVPGQSISGGDPVGAMQAAMVAPADAPPSDKQASDTQASAGASGTESSDPQPATSPASASVAAAPPGTSPSGISPSGTSPSGTSPSGTPPSGGTLSGSPPAGTSSGNPPDAAAASGSPATAASDAPAGHHGGQLPILYFELRKAGHPVNPVPWLKSTG